MALAEASPPQRAWPWPTRALPAAQAQLGQGSRPATSPLPSDGGILGALGMPAFPATCPSLSDGILSNGALARSPSGTSLTADFAQKMGIVDAKQAEIAVFQFVREQLSAVGREITTLRQELANVQAAAVRGEAGGNQALRAAQQLQVELEREAAARQRDTEGVLVTLKQALEKDAYARAARAEEGARAAEVAVQAVEIERAERLRAVQALDAQAQQALRALKAGLDSERAERVQNTEASAAFRAAVEQDVRFRSIATEELTQTVRVAMAALDKEIAERASSGASVEERLAALQREALAEREQRAAMREGVDKRFLEVRELVSHEATACVEVLGTQLRQGLAQVEAEQQRAGLEAQRGAQQQQALLGAEQSGREQQHSALLAQLEALERAMRKEVGRAVEESMAGDARLQQKLLEEREAADRALRVELAKLTSDVQTEHAKLRESDNSFKDQFEQTGRRLEEVSQVASDLNISTRRLGADAVAMQDKFTDSLGGLSKTLKDSVSQLGSRQRDAEGELRDAVQAGDARVRDEVVQLEAALSTKLAHMHGDLSGGLVELRAHTERRCSLIDESLQGEKQAREEGDGALRERLEAFQRAVGDDLQQEGVSREALIFENRSSLETFRQFLETEKQARFEQQAAFNERMGGLQEAVEREQPLAMHRSDFEKEAKRFWEALDTHTHQVQPPPLVPHPKVAQPMVVYEPVDRASRPRLGSANTSPGTSTRFQVATGSTLTMPPSSPKVPPRAVGALRMRSMSGSILPAST